MRILVTGVSGFVGGRLVPRLRRDGHELRGFARDPARVDPALGIPLVVGDAVTGIGLAEALDGIDVAYFLIHSMEPVADDSAAARDFGARERAAAERFAAVARAAGVGGSSTSAASSHATRRPLCTSQAGSRSSGSCSTRCPSRPRCARRS